MQDRQSLFPGRVQLIPVDGQDEVFDVIRADSPSVEGTPLTKATILSDAVAAKLGLSDDAAIPSNGFDKLAAYAGIYSGTCGTAAGTAAKTADITGFALETGATVRVTFTYANTASSPTLDVTSTGAKPIYYAGAYAKPGVISAGLTALLQYDGARWVVLTPGIGNLLSGTLVTGAVSGVNSGAAVTVTLGAMPKRISMGVANGAVRGSGSTIMNIALSTKYDCVLGGMAGETYHLYVTPTSTGLTLQWYSTGVPTAYVILYEAIL
jgi:hypothetical protein